MVEIEKIENSLAGICADPGCERYRDVLYMWYVEKFDKDDIAETLGYSSRQSVYDMRNRAIKKFAVALFGVVALEAI
ncbi:MAG: hypothetical protein ABFD50_03500 [Smithella sp.]